MIDFFDILLEGLLELLVELCYWGLAEIWRELQEIFR
jgi:hypothetical protein